MNKYEILKKYFGYDALREGQEELTESLINGRDALGIMPTGAGKSLCYQIPALMFEGVTVVISPLISLMIDQVKSLNQAGIHAAYINGALTENQIIKALDFAKQGRYKIIYVAPERLESPKFMEFAMETDISLLAVDEAHCISQWGQDFRPSYTKIVEFINKLPKRPIVGAFTATATQRVREDIMCILQLKEPEMVVTGFDRKNLFFSVVQQKITGKKDADIISYVKKHGSESGIIYCSTRKNVEAVCEMLQLEGISAGKYHAGMNNEERKHNQDDFIYDKLTVIVATNAFGMGIDKSNVRYVLHYNMPQSLENYYQEAGRAGRDGENSECILFYSAQDMVINRFLIDSKTENQELNEDEISVLRENDEIRLNKMWYYCQTRECLRKYILNYFGEHDSRECGNCGNCHAEFEEKDVTDICKNIILCIKEINQCYGINVVTDLLMGRNKAKIISFGFDRRSCFGICRQLSEAVLKDIIIELEQKGYINSTNDKYKILKLTNRCENIIENKENIIIKFPKGKISENDYSYSKKQKRWSDFLNSKGLELFDRLKEIRLELAREQAVPPYIICTDKSLVEMCIKLPADKMEMLEINGIGESKFEKYGKIFLNKINKFTDGKKLNLTYESNEGLENKTTEFKTKKRSRKKGKMNFEITDEMLDGIVYENQTTISQFVKMLNELRDECEMKALTTTEISENLKGEKYYQENNIDGYTEKIILPKGIDTGIFLKERIAKSGLSYKVIMYDKKAQEFLVESLCRRWL